MNTYSITAEHMKLPYTGPFQITILKQTLVCGPVSCKAIQGQGLHIANFFS